MVEFVVYVSMVLHNHWSGAQFAKIIVKWISIEMCFGNFSMSSPVKLGIQPKGLVYCLLCLFVNNLIQKAGVVWRWPKLKCIVCAIICNYWQIICYIIPIGCAMQCEGRFRKIHLGLCTFFTSFRSTTRIVVCSSNILENMIWTKAKAKMNFNLRNLILHCMRIILALHLSMGIEILIPWKTN